MQKQSIGKYISSIYRYQSIIINKKFEQYGFGSGQYIFLINIAKNQGINQKELSDMVRIDRANTHRAIKKLEALGYVYTVRDNDDKRIIKSYLTEAGSALMPKIKDDLLSITDILIEDFDVNQRKEIYSLLQKIETNVQKHVKSLREESRNAGE